jgi:hypothetical protein
MQWSVQFYSERRGLVARFSVEALLPAEAVVLGRRALLAEYPTPVPRGRASLFARAGAGTDGDGWVLYRIASVGAGHVAAAAKRAT